MAQTLYRKYRPQTFAEVVGQEHVTKTLLNQIKSGSIAHAYLFTGPRGIGKTTTARLLAKAVNAHDKSTGEPDNAAPINKAISSGRSLDLIEIDAASNRRIEEIRELREHVKYPPNEGKYKIFIIDEVHMLTPEAFNALLKTLEEPPEFVIFILATTEINKLPDTIISRCQRFDFKKVSYEVLEKRLEFISQAEGVKVASDVLKTIVKLSEGCVRDAESFLGQILSLGNKNITTKDAEVFLPKSNVLWLDKLWQAINSNDLPFGMKVIRDMNEADIELEYFYNDWLELLRYILLWKINPNTDEPVYVVSEDIAKSIRKDLKLSLDQIKNIIKVFVHYKQFLALLSVPSLALEMALVEVIGKANKKDEGDGDGDSSFIGKESGKSKPVPNKDSGQSLSQRQVNKKDLLLDWNNVVKKVSETAPSLAHYLKSVVVRQNGNRLDLLVAHSFHYEVIKKGNYIKKIQQAVKTVSGMEAVLNIKLSEEMAAEGQKDNIIDNFINVFGGRVLEEVVDD